MNISQAFHLGSVPRHTPLRPNYPRVWGDGVCVCIRTHIYVRLCVRFCTCVSVRVYICVSVYVWPCARVLCTCLCVRAHSFVRLCTCTHLSTCVCVYVCTFVRASTGLLYARLCPSARASECPCRQRRVGRDYREASVGRHDGPDERGAAVGEGRPLSDPPALTRSPLRLRVTTHTSPGRPDRGPRSRTS